MKFGIFITTVAPIVLPLTLTTTHAISANAAEQSWHIDEVARSIFVADCPECVDNAQISLTCPTTDKMVNINASMLSTAEKSEQKFNHITFDFYGREYVYDAVLTPSVKPDENFPKLSLELDDPIFKTLQKGSSVVVSFLKKKAKLTLRGSQNAIAAFQKFCVEPPKPVVVEPKIDVVEKTDILIEPEPTPEPTPAPIEPKPAKTEPETKATAAKWFVEKLQTASPNMVLNFGTAQSSTAELSADCNSPNTHEIEVKLTTKLDGHKTGEQVMVDFIIDDNTASYSGFVFGKNSDGDRVKFIVAKTDPIWKNISKAKDVTFGSRDGQIKTVNGIAGATAIDDFLKACKAGG